VSVPRAENRSIDDRYKSQTAVSTVPWRVAGKSSVLKKHVMSVALHTWAESEHVLAPVQTKPAQGLNILV
jgi:hypothetical protein